MTEKRQKFGNRFLTKTDDVFSENAWDNVLWTPEIEQEIKDKIKHNSETKVSEKIKNEHIDKADKFWNAFYQKHENNFFKDRHWLTVEFPELVAKKAESKLRIFEVGCGVGNTIFPLIQHNGDNAYIYGCDLSNTAIDLVRAHELYNEEKSCHAFVADITNVGQQYPFEENSLDVITLIYVLSAVSPNKMRSVIGDLVRYLKPGGYILFRDYAACDLAQMRFKNGQCLEDNFYVRGDGTMVYFFAEDEVEQLFTDDENIGLVKTELFTDRRLIVNRAKQSKMYRLWLTGKFRKN